MQQETAEPGEKWDYTVLKSSSGICPTKLLNVTAGQKILVRVYNLAEPITGYRYVYYASATSVVNPRSKRIDATNWQAGVAEQDYTINVIGDGVVRISGGSSGSDGSVSTSFGFYADMYKVRIS